MKVSWFKGGLYSLLLTIFLVLGLAACSSGDGDSSKGGQSDDGDKKIKIGLSMDNLQEERWERDRDYFVERAEELGAEVLVQAANSDDAKQIAQAENMISQGVDILVVIPHDSEVSATIAEMADEAGIPIIAYDRLINNADVDLYVAFDSIEIGEMQAQTIVDLVPKGKYVLIGGSDTDHAAHLYREGQMNVLQPLIDKGDIEVVYDQWTKNWDPSLALTNMENALTANNNEIDAVVASNDGTAGGVIQALAAQGLDGKVPVSGLDAELAAAQRIVEGTQTMTVYTSFRDMANMAAEAAIKLVKGEEIETNATENNGKIDVPTIMIEPYAVTKDNIDDTVIKDGFHSEEDVYRNVE